MKLPLRLGSCVVFALAACDSSRPGAETPDGSSIPEAPDAGEVDSPADADVPGPPDALVPEGPEPVLTNHVVTGLLRRQRGHVAPGDYYVFHDATAFMGYIGKPYANPYELTARLRPVLAAGQACDRDGVANRCVDAACPATGAAVCP